MCDNHDKIITQTELIRATQDNNTNSTKYQY